MSLFSTSCKKKILDVGWMLQKLSKREKIKMGVYSLCREVYREAVQYWLYSHVQ